MAREPLAGKPKRTRLAREDREEIIVRGAIRYFAEVGFTGQTRELARRLGITQGLLFRYFPTKDDLVERVYQEVFLGRWNPQWETILTDRSVPLLERLTAFYLDYGRTIADYEWIRIFTFAGLLGTDLARRYTARFRDRIIVTMCQEIRHELALPPLPASGLSAEEMQICWGLNGAVAMMAQREFIFGMPVRDFSAAITDLVAVFLQGAPQVMGRIAAAQSETQPQPARNNKADRGANGAAKARGRVPLPDPARTSR